MDIAYKFWKDWVKLDSEKQLRHLKPVYESLTQMWKSHDELNKKLKKKGKKPFTTDMKMRILNDYFVDLYDALHGD